MCIRDSSQTPPDPVEGNLSRYPQEILYGDDTPKNNEGSATPGIIANESAVNALESLDASDHHAHQSAAVSYTHLDVYKRQEINKSAFMERAK